MTIPYRKVPPPESAPGREHPEVQPRGMAHADIPVRAAGDCRPYRWRRPTATHSTYSTFSTRLNLYTVKFISRREASQSCQSCLKPLLHVLPISTANIDRPPSPILHSLHSLHGSTPFPPPLQFYTSTRPITVRAAGDCRPYRREGSAVSQSCPSCKSCLKPLLPVLPIFTADIDRPPLSALFASLREINLTV